MIDHQEHFGRRFYQDKKTGYWISCDHPRIRAHRWVWISIHGKIPIGYHIHHKDENKSNNNIENLELISASRHCSIHYSEERREFCKNLMHKIRPLTKKWHSSNEGKAWHSLHAIKTKFGNREAKDYVCDQCGCAYQSKNVSGVRFCSNACKSKWRRLSGIDDVQISCANCLKIFSKNKYGKERFCCKICAQRARLIK
jgi:hypothetical protein